MAVSRVQTSYQTQASVTQLGALWLAPRNEARRLINATVDAFSQCTANLLFSREADAEHDAYQLSVDQLSKLGIKNALVKGCGCERGFIAIGVDNSKAMAANARDGNFVEQVLTLTRRWSRALERALCLRRRSRP